MPESRVLANLPSVRVVETVHRPRSCMPLHQHAEPYLCFVARGSYVQRIGRRIRSCDTLRVCYHSPGAEHANEFGDAGAACIKVELGAAWDSDVAHLGLINHDDFLTGPLGAWAALQIARQAPHAESDGGFSIEDLTALLLAEGARLRREASATAASASLSRAIAFIRDQPRHRYSLTDVARAAELHPTHLARAFKTRVGLTIGEYARRARVSWAQDALLRHPDWSLARVAAEAGFSDHAHFCRVFARVVGAPPSVMRNRLLETRLGTYDAKEGFERP